MANIRFLVFFFLFPPYLLFAQALPYEYRTIYDVSSPWGPASAACGFIVSRLQSTGRLAENRGFIPVSEPHSYCDIWTAFPGSALVSQPYVLESRLMAPCPEGSEFYRGVCVPKCAFTERRINGVCERNRCPISASQGQFSMLSSSTEFVCYFHSNLTGYCQLRVDHDVSVDYGTGLQHYGIGRTTGAECTPGTPGLDPLAPDPGPPDPSGPAAPPGPLPVPPLPPVEPQPPEPDGSCPPGSAMRGGVCIRDPVPPSPAGVCPPGSVSVGGSGGSTSTVCVFPQPAPPSGGGGSGGGSGGGGDGEGDGESGFGGVCVTGFTCSGDAIQCAIAREQHIRNCSFWESPSPERSLYDASKGLTGNRTTDLPGNTSFSIGPASFDQTNLLGGSSGISDRTILVMGSSITIPFSSINIYLAALGNVLVAVSLLLAGRIVIRG